MVYERTHLGNFATNAPVSEEKPYLNLKELLGGFGIFAILTLGKEVVSSWGYQASKAGLENHWWTTVG